jgi:hypothetical protein
MTELPRLELYEDPNKKNDFIIFRNQTKSDKAFLKKKREKTNKKIHKKHKTRKNKKSKSIFNIF